MTRALADEYDDAPEQQAGLREFRAEHGTRCTRDTMAAIAVATEAYREQFEAMSRAARGET